MQRRHKYLWMKGWAWADYTWDCAYEKPKIQKNERTICRKIKRRYFKTITDKDIKDYYSDKY